MRPQNLSREEPQSVGPAPGKLPADFDFDFDFGAASPARTPRARDLARTAGRP